MAPLDAATAPWRAAQAVIRAGDDLHTLAERARRDPDPVDEARERLDRLGGQLESLISVARSLDASAASIDSGAAALLEVTRALHGTARTIVTGGEDLRRTGEALDAHTQEIIGGGEELTAVAEELAGSLRVFRGALPQVLEGLHSVEELEDSVGTVAETVEPLQGLTQGVGRVSQRLVRGA